MAEDGLDAGIRVRVARQLADTVNKLARKQEPQGHFLRASGCCDSVDNSGLRNVKT